MGSHPRRTAPHICTTKIILFSTKSKSTFAIINKLFHTPERYFAIGRLSLKTSDFTHFLPSPLSQNRPRTKRGRMRRYTPNDVLSPAFGQDNTP